MQVGGTEIIDGGTSVIEEPGQFIGLSTKLAARPDLALLALIGKTLDQLRSSTPKGWRSSMAPFLYRFGAPPSLVSLPLTVKNSYLIDSILPGRLHVGRKN